MLNTSLPRPTYLPVDAKRLRVIQLFAFGLAPNQIAFVLKIHLKTLQVFYSRELQLIPTSPKPQPSRKIDQFQNAHPLPASIRITGPNGALRPTA